MATRGVESLLRHLYSGFSVGCDAVLVAGKPASAQSARDRDSEVRRSTLKLMSIAKHPLSALAEVDLRALITGAVRESRTLEFKRETYGADDKSRAEFLADISALANTLGGDLVLGINEDQGVASGLPGLKAGIDVDQEMLRLTQIAQSGLESRLPALEMHPVPLAGGGTALVIRVGRSYTGPHRVVFGGRNRFWARSGAGKYEPDVGQLRELFSAAPQLAARMREMRADRLAQVIAGETPVRLADDSGIAVLHIIPFVAAAPLPRLVNLDRLRSQTSASFLPGSTGYNWHRGFDGFTTYSDPVRGNTLAYVQVFRSGMIEAVTAAMVSIRNVTRTVSVNSVARNLLHQVAAVLPALQAADVEPPYSIQLAMAGVRGATFASESSSWGMPSESLPTKRDVLQLVDVVATDGDVTRDQCALVLRPILDQLFQTAGQDRCTWFSADGSLMRRLALPNQPRQRT